MPEQQPVARVALIGHSRGGEAVAIANALNGLERDPDEGSMDGDVTSFVGSAQYARAG